MPPGVKRSLVEGFRVAGRSWGGIGLFVLAWLVVGLIVVAGLALSRPPATLLEAPPAAVAPVAPAAEEAAAAPETAAAPVLAQTEQQQQLNAWLGRAWPVLLFGFVLLIAAGLLIQGGQVGYVTQQVRAGRATWADMSGAATRSFGSLLGAGCLSFAAVGVGVGVAALLIAALQALSGVVVAVVGIVLVLAMVAGVVWLSLRLALWPIAIVAERLGPVAGLKASWRLSRGRWWTLLGITATFLVISLGIAIISALAEGLSNVIGGGVALAMQLLNALVTGAANLFLSFATMGALVRFHEDAKGTTS